MSRPLRQPDDRADRAVTKTAAYPVGVHAAQAPRREGRPPAAEDAECDADAAHRGAGGVHRRADGRSVQDGLSLPLLRCSACSIRSGSSTRWRCSRLPYLVPSIQIASFGTAMARPGARPDQRRAAPAADPADAAGDAADAGLFMFVINGLFFQLAGRSSTACTSAASGRRCSAPCSTALFHGRSRHCSSRRAAASRSLPGTENEAHRNLHRVLPAADAGRRRQAARRAQSWQN